MPTGYKSLFDLAQAQNNDMITGLIEDVTTYAPEFMSVPVISRAGTTYKVLRRTGLPPSGFRVINAGVAPGKSALKQEVKEMYALDSQFQMDEMIVKGDDRSAGDVLTQEAQGGLQSAIITIGSQFYYGTSADANGFSGLRSQLAGVQAAGGTTNTTSAYLVWLNPQGVHFDVGNDGAIAMNPWTRQQVNDPNDSTKKLFAWVSNLSCFIGLTVGSQYAVWAVTGINSSNKLTDALGAQLLSQIPLNRRQGLQWFMNRTAEFTLQSSRSAILYQPAGTGGTPAWAPTPTMLAGAPIIVTDSITNTEDNT